MMDRGNAGKKLVLLEVFTVIALPTIEPFNKQHIEVLFGTGFKLVPLAIIGGVIGAAIHLIRRHRPGTTGQPVGERTPGGAAEQTHANTGFQFVIAQPGPRHTGTHAKLPLVKAAYTGRTGLKHRGVVGTAAGIILAVNHAIPNYSPVFAHRLAQGARRHQLCEETATITG